MHPGGILWLGWFIIIVLDGKWNVGRKYMIWRDNTNIISLATKQIIRLASTEQVCFPTFCLPCVVPLKISGSARAPSIPRTSYFVERAGLWKGHGEAEDWIAALQQRGHLTVRWQVTFHHSCNPIPSIPQWPVSSPDSSLINVWTNVSSTLSQILFT